MTDWLNEMYEAAKGAGNTTKNYLGAKTDDILNSLVMKNGERQVSELLKISDSLSRHSLIFRDFYEAQRKMLIQSGFNDNEVIGLMRELNNNTVNSTGMVVNAVQKLSGSDMAFSLYQIPIFKDLIFALTDPKESSLFQNFKTTTDDLLTIQERLKNITLETGAVGTNYNQLLMSLQNASALTARLGISREELIKTQEKYNELLGTSRVLRTDELTLIAEISAATGKNTDTITGYLAKYQLLGGSQKEFFKLTEDAVNMADIYGVNASKIVDKIYTNIANAEKFNFKNPIEDLTKMAVKAETLKIDLNDAFNVTATFRGLDDSISKVAQLQLLGKEFAQLNAFDISFTARQDPAKAMEKIMSSFQSYGIFDAKTGAVSISDLDTEKIQEASKILTISYDQARQYVVQATKINQILKSNRNFTREQAEIMANIATYDTTDKTFKITKMVDEKTSKEIDIKLLNKNEIDDILKKEERGLTKRVLDTQSVKDLDNASKAASDAFQLTTMTHVDKIGEKLMQHINLLEQSNSVLGYNLAESSRNALMAAQLFSQSYITGVEFTTTGGAAMTRQALAEIFIPVTNTMLDGIIKGIQANPNSDKNSVFTEAVQILGEIKSRYIIQEGLSTEERAKEIEKLSKGFSEDDVTKLIGVAANLSKEMPFVSQDIQKLLSRIDTQTGAIKLTPLETPEANTAAPITPAAPQVQPTQNTASMFPFGNMIGGNRTDELLTNLAILNSKGFDKIDKTNAILENILKNNKMKPDDAKQDNNFLNNTLNNITNLFNTENLTAIDENSNNQQIMLAQLLELNKIYGKIDSISEKKFKDSDIKMQTSIEKNNVFSNNTKSFDIKTKELEKKELVREKLNNLEIDYEKLAKILAQTLKQSLTENVSKDKVTVDVNVKTNDMFDIDVEKKITSIVNRFEKTFKR